MDEILAQWNSAAEAYYLTKETSAYVKTNKAVVEGRLN